MQMCQFRAMRRLPQHLQGRVPWQPRLANHRLRQRVAQRANKVGGAALPACWCNCMCMALQVCQTTSLVCFVLKVLTTSIANDCLSKSCNFICREPRQACSKVCASQH